jgi:hypothetical protein
VPRINSFMLAFSLLFGADGKDFGGPVIGDLAVVTELFVNESEGTHVCDRRY